MPTKTNFINMFFFLCQEIVTNLPCLTLQVLEEREREKKISENFSFVNFVRVRDGPLPRSTT